MPKFRVPVFRSATKTVEVEQGSTRGAQLGVNLYDEAGNVLTTAALIALIGSAIDIPVPSTEPPQTVWGNIGEVPSDALSVLGNPTNAEAKPIAIVAGNNDRVLRRVANVLDWGFLTAGMFPDSMVTILSGTEFEIVTTQMDLHGQFHVTVPSGSTAPVIINGDTGSSTRPAISIYNQALQGNRQILRVWETDNSGRSGWLQANLSGTFADNYFEIGFDYTSGGGAANALRIYSNGRVYSTGDTEGGSTLLWTPASNATFVLDANAGTMNVTFSATGDSVLTIEADTDNDSGAGEEHNAYMVFSQDGGAVITRMGLVGLLNNDPASTVFTGAPANSFVIHHPEPSGAIAFGTQNAVAILIDANNDVSIINGADLLVGVVGGNNLFYDVSAATLFLRSLTDVILTLEADTDNVTETDNPTLRFLQDGALVDARIGFSGAVNVDSMGSTFTGGVANALTFSQSNSSADAQMQFGVQGSISFLIDSNNDLNLRAGNVFRIYDSANTDIGAFSHDGTNFNEAFTNTTSRVWTGITGLTVPSGFAITTGGGTFSILGTGETLATFADDGAVVLYHNNTIRIQTSANGVEIPGGSSLRIQDAANTDYGQFAHDGTDFLTTFVNTGKWDVTVTELELNGNLDLDGIFDNDQTIALGGGATATLGTIGGSGPTAAGQSEWLRIRINGADRWIPVWL